MALYMGPMRNYSPSLHLLLAHILLTAAVAAQGWQDWNSFFFLWPLLHLESCLKAICKFERRYPCHRESSVINTTVSARETAIAGDTQTQTMRTTCIKANTHKMLSAVKKEEKKGPKNKSCNLHDLRAATCTERHEPELLVLSQSFSSNVC